MTTTNESDTPKSFTFITPHGNFRFFGANGKLNPSVKKLWLEALRGQEYVQCQGQLKKEGGFCCLGVLTDVAMKRGVCKRKWANDDESEMTSLNSHSGAPSEVGNWAANEPLLPQFLCSMVQEDENANFSQYSHFATLNDSHKLTFAQIADLIEAFM